MKKEGKNEKSVSMKGRKNRIKKKRIVCLVIFGLRTNDLHVKSNIISLVVIKYINLKLRV